MTDDHELAQLYDEPAVANAIGVHVQTLKSWRRAGKGPDHVKVGRKIRYRAEAVERWLEENSVSGDGTDRWH